LTITRPAKIIVDNNGVLPAERSRPRHQGVLPVSALGVIDQLIRRRLADVDVSLSRQMLTLLMAEHLAADTALPVEATMDKITPEPSANSNCRSSGSVHKKRCA
jgi:hypothetical protein